MPYSTIRDIGASKPTIVLTNSTPIGSVEQSSHSSTPVPIHSQLTPGSTSNQSPGNADSIKENSVKVTVAGYNENNVRNIILLCSSTTVIIAFISVYHFCKITLQNCNSRGSQCVLCHIQLPHFKIDKVSINVINTPP